MTALRRRVERSRSLQRVGVGRVAGAKHRQLCWANRSFAGLGTSRAMAALTPSGWPSSSPLLTTASSSLQHLCEGELFVA